MTDETPIWKFDKIEITYLQPILGKNDKKSTVRCHASIDFGFFFVMDIGLTRDGDTISWSTNFGWSNFKFNSSQIDNPYCKEVTKLMQMVKQELDMKRSTIIDFLDDPATMPKIVKN